MPRRPWNHPFVPSHEYDRDYVVSVCMRHIQEEGVENPEEKRRYVNQIRECQHERIVFTPIGSGWGNLQ